VFLLDPIFQLTLCSRKRHSRKNKKNNMHKNKKNNMYNRTIHYHNYIFLPIQLKSTDFTERKFNNILLFNFRIIKKLVIVKIAY